MIDVLHEGNIPWYSLYLIHSLVSKDIPFSTSAMTRRNDRNVLSNIIYYIGRWCHILFNLFFHSCRWVWLLSVNIFTCWFFCFLHFIYFNFLHFTLSYSTDGCNIYTSITLSEAIMSENLCSAPEAIVRSASDALSCVWMVFETYVRTLIYGYACGSLCCSSRAGDEVKGCSYAAVV